MKYISTRGDKTTTYSFETALTSGYAPDGGLFVPLTLPTKLTQDQLESWSKLGYPALAAECLSLFISNDEIPYEDLKELCRSSFYSKDIDGDGFDDPEHAVLVQPLRKKDDDALHDASIFISELFHGPTFCFKDLGMKFVVNALSYFCDRRKQKMTLLVSTTGDTGPAAVQSVSDLPKNDYLTILVHYPKGQISALQRKQLTTVNSKNVRVATFEGGGDDMDAPIKNMLTGKSLYVKEKCQNRKLCGVNSYNIGRPLMQMVHYVWTYLRVVEKMGVSPGSPDVNVDIIMPTGAMGNITGGYIAKKIGIPLGFLCSGVNTNDITHRVMQTGKFYKSAVMEKTLSDAINVQVPYNFERILYYLCDGDQNLICKWMKTMEVTQKLDLDNPWLNKLKSEFHSARITDDEMCQTMRQIYDQLDYLVDPHTSVAIAAAAKLGYMNLSREAVSSNESGLQCSCMIKDFNKNPVAILSTASPCKFEESVTAAIGETNWLKYYESDSFPRKARMLLEKEELTPALYAWEEGATLIEVQEKWEQLATDIIATQFT